MFTPTLKSPDFYLNKKIEYTLENIRIKFPTESNDFIEGYITAMEEIQKSLII